MRILTTEEIDALIVQAGRLEGRRMALTLHKQGESVQSRINAMLPHAYVRPGKHENSAAGVLFSVLRGRLACLQFSELGQVEAVHILDANGPLRIADIPPGVYHTLLALGPAAVLEIIRWPCEGAADTQPAAWAPPEDSPAAADYVLHLQAIVHNWPS